MVHFSDLRHLFRSRLVGLILSGILSACSTLPPVAKPEVGNTTTIQAGPLSSALPAEVKEVSSHPQSSLSTPVPVTAVVQPMPKPIKIGLALGGGAARGFAHIGVIKALEAQGIEPDLVVGTSAGSVVGAFYAAGMSGFELQRLASKMEEASIADWILPIGSRGVLKGEALQSYVNRVLKNRSIEVLAKPLGIVATDLQNGQPMLFQRGNTGIAVRASSSVPGVFLPVLISGREYVDGGLVSPVPVRFARKMGADFVIAVDISARPDAAPINTTLDTLLQTFSIMGQTISQFELKEADIVIRPALRGMSGTDFNTRNQSILAGEQAVAKVIKELKEALREAKLK